MKFIKKGTAISLCVALLLSLIATTFLVIGASKAWSGAQLGDLSQYYEIGDSADPGFISTVAGDSGGTSYGLYMFASNAGTPYDFALWCQNYSGDELISNIGSSLVSAYLNPSPGYGSNFNATWQWFSQDSNYRQSFINAQKEYWRVNRYNLLLSNIQTVYPTFDINCYSIALQNVLWSRSVQHGVDGAFTVFKKAIDRLGGTFCYQSELDLINAIYIECSKLDSSTASNSMQGSLAKKYGIDNRSMSYYSANSGAVQVSVYRRLRINEPNDAFAMYAENLPSNNTLHDGYYTIMQTDYQTQFLSNTSGSAIVGASTDTESIKMKVSSFLNSNSSAYTIENNGQRLTDNGGSVRFTSNSTSKAQLWMYNGGLFQNVQTGYYLRLNNNAFDTVSESTNATNFTVSYASGVCAYGLVYPGFEDGLTYSLPNGSSGFPLRGTIFSAVPLSSIQITVTGTNGFTVSKSISSSYSYDLWKLDDECRFSSLGLGDHAITITASDINGQSFTLVNGKAFSVVQGEASETYQVAFVSNSSTIATKQYTLGDVYGELPTASKSGSNFIGWFNEDGVEITTTSMVPAKNHTLTARFDNLHSYYFLNYDGSVFKSGQLSAGQNIPLPTTNPSRAGYSFVGWENYTIDATMGTEDISFTPVFTTAGSSSGGSSGGSSTTTSGSYLSGIVPNTSVSTLTAGGYVVKSGDAVVTSGLVGTGMTAVANGTSITIVVTGDTNGDGKLSITDVVQLQSYVAGSTSLSGAYKEAADVNKDGSVSITDVVQAAQVTVGNRTLTK